jgi:hypothetical protein
LWSFQGVAQLASVGLTTAQGVIRAKAAQTWIVVKVERRLSVVEELEAAQRLLPEQLKAMLKALAQSNLLRGDTR